MNSDSRIAEIKACFSYTGDAHQDKLVCDDSKLAIVLEGIVWRGAFTSQQAIMDCGHEKKFRREPLDHQSWPAYCALCQKDREIERMRKALETIAAEYYTCDVTRIANAALQGAK